MFPELHLNASLLKGNCLLVLTSIPVVRPDVTVVVDYALMTNYSSIYLSTPVETTCDVSSLGVPFKSILSFTRPSFRLSLSSFLVVVFVRVWLCSEVRNTPGLAFVLWSEILRVWFCSAVRNTQVWFCSVVRNTRGFVLFCSQKHSGFGFVL